MSWADEAIKKLIKGQDVQIRPKGSSMKSYINSGQLVTVQSAANFELSELKLNDIVLCQVKGRDYLHLIKRIRRDTDAIRFQIGNARGNINGWASFIFGRVTKIED